MDGARDAPSALPFLAKYLDGLARDALPSEDGALPLVPKGGSYADAAEASATLAPHARSRAGIRGTRLGTETRRGR